MFKKLLVVVCAALFLTVGAGNVFAGPGNPFEDADLWYHTGNGKIKAGDQFKNGHPGKKSQWVPCTAALCGDPSGEGNAVALAKSKAEIDSKHLVVKNKSMSWGSAGGKDLTLRSRAFATGEDKKVWKWTLDGFAFAHANSEMDANVYVKQFTNGVKNNGGLSFTYAKAIGVLNFDSKAIATGGIGDCPQWAKTELKGAFLASVGAHSLSRGDNFAYATTWGNGTTGVRVYAYDSEFDNTTHFFGLIPAYADADLSGKVLVTQDILTMSYVKPDGTMTFNFGKIEGGNGYAFGDANITGVRSSGIISQKGMATDGFGAYASGSSSAQYQGATGYVYGSRCISGANGSGLAVVTGYNNVVNTGSSVQIKSSQTAFATTGGGYSPPQVD